MSRPRLAGSIELSKHLLYGTDIPLAVPRYPREYFQNVNGCYDAMLTNEGLTAHELITQLLLVV